MKGNLASSNFTWQVTDIEMDLRIGSKTMYPGERGLQPRNTLGTVDGVNLRFCTSGTLTNAMQPKTLRGRREVRGFICHIEKPIRE